MSQAFARALQCYWAISSHSQDGVRSPREWLLSLLRCSWCTLTMRPSVRSATWTRTTRWPLRPTLSHYFVLSLFPLLSGTAGSHPDNLARSSAMVGGHFRHNASFRPDDTRAGFCPAPHPASRCIPCAGSGRALEACQSPVADLGKVPGRRR